MHLQINFQVHWMRTVATMPHSRSAANDAAHKARVKFLNIQDPEERRTALARSKAAAYTDVLVEQATSSKAKARPQARKEATSKSKAKSKGRAKPPSSSSSSKSSSTSSRTPRSPSSAQRRRAADAAGQPTGSAASSSGAPGPSSFADSGNTEVDRDL